MATATAVVNIGVESISGPVLVGTGATRKQRGHINASSWIDPGKPLGCLGEAMQAAISALDAIGGGVIEVLGGTYEVYAPFDIHDASIEIRISPAATINIMHAGTIGFGRIASCTGAVVRGGKIVPSVSAPGQVALKFEDGFANRCDGVTISYTVGAVGTAENPSIGILAEDETESVFSYCRCVPTTGVIGFRDATGTKNVWMRPYVTNGKHEGTIDVIVSRDAYIGIDLYDCEFVDVIHPIVWGIGIPLGTQPIAMLRIFGSGAETEDGHCTIDSPHMEGCAPDAYILIEGSQGWVTIENPQLGFANLGIGVLGHAGIKVTQNAAATRKSTRVDIQGGRIHNIGRSVGSAQQLFALTRGTIVTTPAGVGTATVDVTGTDTFHLASGSWGVTPVAGEWIATSGFTDAANNGHFKVVSADANDITVDTTLSGALVNESGTANEKITGEAAFEGSAIWLEHCSEVNIRGLSITDQRHQWGIAIDTTTVRGVTIDDITFHKGSGNGAVSPFRMPTETLPNVGSNFDDSEGVLIGSVLMKTWGATPVVFGDGTVSPTLVSAASTITVTNAPFFQGLLGDNSSNYDAAGVATTADQLTLIRRMS